MKKLLLLMLGMASYVSGFAGEPTATTVYYAVPSDVVGSYSVKFNACTEYDNSTGNSKWTDLLDMTLTDKTYLGYLIYSIDYTDLWGGVRNMQFALYNGETWVSQQEPIYNDWKDVDFYNGKMYVHNVGWDTYQYDKTLSITYHVQATESWTPSCAYEYKGDINSGWPGATMTVNPWNTGWYDYTVTNPYTHIIFNNGGSGNGNQTGNIDINVSNDEYWYTYTVSGDVGTTTSIEKPSNWLNDYQRTGLTVGNFGTICLPFNATIDGATVYTVESKVMDGTEFKGINLGDPVEILEAGKPYIFKATNTTLTATTSGDRVYDAIDAYNMVGNLSSTPMTVPSNANNYIVGTDNKIHEAGENVTIGQYKGYINVGSMAPSRRGANFIGVDDEATGIESVVNENIQNVVYNLQGQRVMDAHKGLVIVNGKKMLR